MSGVTRMLLTTLIVPCGLVVGLGCHTGGSGRAAYTPNDVRALLDRAHLGPSLKLWGIVPDERKMNPVEVVGFPGGVGISWPYFGVTNWDEPQGLTFFFTDEGCFMSAAERYVLGDVTGDGTLDLVAVEIFALPERAVVGYYCTVYPMDKPPLPARRLGMMGTELWPVVLEDFNGDGVLEIVCNHERPVINLPSPDIPRPERQVDSVLAVWSLKYGIPRLLLALEWAWALPPWQRSPVGGRGGGPGALPWICVPERRPNVGAEESRWIEIPWDAKGRKFDISAAKGRDLVIVWNAPLLD